jgi:hypothetical protein
MQIHTSPLGDIMLVRSRVIYLVIDGVKTAFIEEYTIDLK